MSPERFVKGESERTHEDCALLRPVYHWCTILGWFKSREVS